MYSGDSKNWLNFGELTLKIFDVTLKVRVTGQQNLIGLTGLMAAHSVCVPYGSVLIFVVVVVVVVNLVPCPELFLRTYANSLILALVMVWALTLFLRGFSP